MDDDQLMIRVQSGDAAAFGLLVQKYQGPLYGFFYRNSHDVQLAEDLTQDTLLKVFSQAWDYLPSGRFRGWMYRIGRNLMIDSVRRRRTDALVHAWNGRSDDDEQGLARLVSEIMPPEDVANQRELAGMVEVALEEIPAEQRQTFILHHYSGLSLAEVADAMETTTPTAKSRLRLAREKLQEKLRARGVRPPGEPAHSDNGPTACQSAGQPETPHI